MLRQTMRTADATIKSIFGGWLQFSAMVKRDRLVKTGHKHRKRTVTISFLFFWTTCTTYGYDGVKHVDRWWALYLLSALFASQWEVKHSFVERESEVNSWWKVVLFLGQWEVKYSFVEIEVKFNSSWKLSSCQ